MNEIILLNALGIKDSGGITVLGKLFDEIKDSKYNFIIICNQNKNMKTLYNKHKNIKNFEFQFFPTKGFIYRLYLENILFKKIIIDNNINLVYNFSGSAQFFSKTIQISKIHNLLFYSKKIDNVYYEKEKYIKWFKQIYLKRIVFHCMVRQSEFIEIQSCHVKEYMSDFINIFKKQFFIKSDIDVNRELFKKIKEYDFSKKLRFLFIVGPHFEYLHKNIQDFVKTMKIIKDEKFDFEIIITLSKEQLNTSNLWDKNLDNHTKFLGYVSKNELNRQFIDNTVLISTSVIETLGLHVVEGIQNGILTIVPNEKYCRDVYGKDVLKYELFDYYSLSNKIRNIVSLNNNEIKDIICKNQKYLIDNENTKYQNILSIFNEILIKGNDV